MPSTVHRARGREPSASPAGTCSGLSECHQSQNFSGKRVLRRGGDVSPCCTQKEGSGLCKESLSTETVSDTYCTGDTQRPASPVIQPAPARPALARDGHSPWNTPCQHHCQPQMPFSLCTSMGTSPPLLEKGQASPSNSTSETWLQPHSHHFLPASYRFSALASCCGSPNLCIVSPSRLLRVQLLPGTPSTFSPPGESDLSFKLCSGFTSSPCFPPDEPLLLCLISAPHTCFDHSTRHTVL